MPTKFVEKHPQAAAAYTGNHAGIGVDSDDNQLYFNATGTRKKVSAGTSADLTATNTLTAAESGSVYFLNSGTEFVTTLPALAAGLNFRFYVKAAPSGASYTIVTESAANNMVGTIHSSTGGNADSEASGGDTFSFVDGAAVKGDRADFFCDGTNWFVTAFVDADTGATITTAA